MTEGRDAWIRIVPEREAEGKLAALYRKMVDPETGQVDNVLRIHGQHPDSLDAHHRLYRTLMYGESGVTRAERETIAVVVSAINRCHY